MTVRARSAGWAPRARKATIWITTLAKGPDLPATVEAQTQATWVCDVDTALMRLVHAPDRVERAGPTVRVLVELGTGKQLVSRESVRL